MYKNSQSEGIPQSKKNLLVLIDWYWPGYRAGGPITSCSNMVDELIEDYNFYFITRNVDYGDSTEYQNVVRDSWNRIKEGLSIYYISGKNLKISNIFRLLNDKKIDAFYINGIYSFYFSILPLLLINKRKHKVIVAPRGMLAGSAIAIKKLKKTLFLFLAKAFNLYKNVTLHVTNVNESNNVFESLGKNCNVVFAPNIPKKTIISNTPKAKTMGHLNLVYISRIAPEKNLHYALQVLTKIHAGSLIFDVYGPIYSEPYWQLCKEIIESLPTNIKLEYKGALPSDKVPEAFSDAHVLFLPTLGENFGHIILESLSAGVPVLLSDQTPWNALENAEAGWCIPLTEKGKFVEVIEKCIKMDSAEYYKISLNASVYAQKQTANSNYKKFYNKLFC